MEKNSRTNRIGVINVTYTVNLSRETHQQAKKKSAIIVMTLYEDTPHKTHVVLRRKKNNQTDYRVRIILLDTCLNEKKGL